MNKARKQSYGKQSYGEKQLKVTRTQLWRNKARK